MYEHFYGEFVTSSFHQILRVAKKNQNTLRTIVLSQVKNRELRTRIGKRVKGHGELVVDRQG